MAMSTIATTTIVWGDASAEMSLQVERLIEKLASPRFSDRVAATQSLQRLGVKGIEPLERIVVDGMPDASDRALSILKSHLQSDWQELSDAARESLQRIATDADSAAASAASKILAPEKKSIQSPNLRPQIIRPQIQLAPPVRQQNRISVSVKTINGKREISVNENGRRFQFGDDGDGLKVQRPDGNGGMKSTRYKDEDAMMKADKEAFEIYKRYASGNGVQIRAGGVWNNFPGGLPPGFRAPQLPAIPRDRFGQPPRLGPKGQAPQPRVRPAEPKKQPKVDLIEV
jgi:hypothetical protein